MNGIKARPPTEEGIHPLNHKSSVTKLGLKEFTLMAHYFELGVRDLRVNNNFTLHT